MATSMADSSSSQPRRRGLILSLGMNGVLLMLAGGLLLYAFMLNVDLGDMKRRLSKEIEIRLQAERYLVETRNQLTESLLEIERLNAQLTYQDSDYQAAPPIKPALPVVVGFRASMLGKGLVAEIENTSDRFLTVTLTVRNPTLSTASRFTLELTPGARSDFGHLEGWQFASGDELGLYHDDFGSIRLSVP